jgi:predicted dehydrogenase
MSGPARIAVVGTGAIAQLAHLPVLTKLRGAAQVVALVDSDGPKARALADRFGVPDAFTDIGDLLEYGDLTAAIVATPNHLHEPHVLELIAAGVDVFCERPPSLNAGRRAHPPRGHARGASVRRHQSPVPQRQALMIFRGAGAGR